MNKAIGILFFPEDDMNPSSPHYGKVSKVIPADKATISTPRFIFRLPILHKTAFPVLLVAPREKGKVFYNLTWLNISKGEELGQVDKCGKYELDGYIPDGTHIAEASDWTQEAMLAAAERAQKPLADSPEVAHVLTDLQAVSPDYYRDKIDTREHGIFLAKQDFFIAYRWNTWEARPKVKWRDRVQDMASHGLWQLSAAKNKFAASEEMRRAEKALQNRARDLKARSVA